LIARVASGEWDTDNPTDKANVDALAAKGYWRAFQKVRSVADALFTKAQTRDVLRSAHREWYRELFAEHVAVGLIPTSQLAGYRSGTVFIRGSRHVPPRQEAVREAMPKLFDLLEGEAEPLVRALLGHWLVGYIHPFPDGNGRIARFLMNVLLAEAGLPWTIVRVGQRDEYMAALETASSQADLRPFTRLLVEQMSIKPRSIRKRSPKRN
jgi:Fic family protein